MNEKSEVVRTIEGKDKKTGEKGKKNQHDLKELMSDSRHQLPRAEFWVFITDQCQISGSAVSQDLSVNISIAWS